MSASAYCVWNLNKSSCTESLPHYYYDDNVVNIRHSFYGSLHNCYYLIFPKKKITAWEHWVAMGEVRHILYVRCTGCSSVYIIIFIKLLCEMLGCWMVFFLFIYFYSLSWIMLGAPLFGNLFFLSEQVSRKTKGGEWGRAASTCKFCHDLQSANNLNTILPLALIKSCGQRYLHRNHKRKIFYHFIYYTLFIFCNFCVFVSVFLPMQLFTFIQFWINSIINLRHFFPYCYWYVILW